MTKRLSLILSIQMLTQVILYFFQVLWKYWQSRNLFLLKNLIKQNCPCNTYQEIQFRYRYLCPSGASRAHKLTGHSTLSFGFFLLTPLLSFMHMEWFSSAHNTQHKPSEPLFWSYFGIYKLQSAENCWLGTSRCGRSHGEAWWNFQSHQVKKTRKIHYPILKQVWEKACLFLGY